MTPLKKFYVVTFVLTLVLSGNVQASERKKDLSLLKKLSSVKVTLATKQPEDPFEVPAAVYVITRDDIKRSGATSIPEILRLAPGIQVARMGAERWAVAARGNNDTITNKLLVLIDGRSVYTPVFSGVNWEAQNVMIEDIKQIEVIRGPGASLWGANAVNGIINVITEDAVNTLGKQINITQGNIEHIASARVGGEINPFTYYRLYGKRSDTQPSRSADGNDTRDEWNSSQAGFRVDWDKQQNSITFQGDIYDTKVDRNATVPTINTPYSIIVPDDNHLKGYNILGRYKHVVDSSSNYAIQSYIDHFERNFDLSREAVTTFDFDFQHNFHPLDRHEITWGTGYRLTHIEKPDRFYFQFSPNERDDNLFSAFAQDKITLIKDKLNLTIGSKFEYNDYTDFEAQPNARLAWTPNKNHTIWGAVSRAVRTPNYAEHNIQQIVGVVKNVGFIALVGSEQMKSERLTSYEAGYRTKVIPKTYIDISTFYNDYDNLRTLERGTAFGNITVPLIASNRGAAQSYGGEIAATYDATDRWQLKGSYSFLVVETDKDTGSTDTSLVSEEGKSPKNQFNISSHLKLPYDIKMDNTLYYVDNLSSVSIPTYWRFDTMFSWEPRKGIELSLVGQNIFDQYHKEFIAIPSLEQSEIGRSIYGKVSVTF